MGSAAFGPSFSAAGVSGPFAVVDDGSGTTEGCGPLVGFPAGAVAIADRGTCPFVDKVLNAQNAGATAVIIGNNAPGATIALGGANPAITIPSGMVTQADATTIKAGLPATGTVRANPDIPPQRDGDLENG
ncbi:PA domain-containing protein, partial [Aquipuribacter sp. MA13-6]|uniref:PA domain-containing protein n=1 Tax=unclassified Aquipuribacter TaxID=2635084 RepID=UPI003EE9149B